jgi:signal peptidase I
MMVFRYPEHPDQSFVKRVIGLPGDTIEARGGHPVINGWEVPSCPVGTYTYQEAYDGTGHSGELFIEFLDEEAFFVFLDRSSFGNDYQGPFTFDGYFVMGDNRNNAHDSRMWNGGQGGGVPKDHVQGRARYQWFPSFGDYASPPVAPLPELSAAVERCLNERPPRDKTSPPKR